MKRLSVSTAKLKKSIPLWSILLVLLFGFASGFYASYAVSQATNASASKAPDFTVQASPSSQNIAQGSLTSFTIQLSSLNSFAGSVNLNVTLTPMDGNVTLALNPSSVSLLTGSGTSTLTVSTLSTASIGTFTVALGATSGKIVHSVILFVQVGRVPSPDFTIVSSPTSMVINLGSSGSFNLNLASLNGFSGTINLSATITPGGGNSPTLALNPNRLTLVAGGTGSAVLTVTTNGATFVGNYVIVVLATGTTSHSVTITLTVQ